MFSGMVAERATTGMAVGGVSLPWWWPYVTALEGPVVTLLPILSALWLSLQIANFMTKLIRKLVDWWRGEG